MKQFDTIEYRCGAANIRHLDRCIKKIIINPRGNSDLDAVIWQSLYYYNKNDIDACTYKGRVYIDVAITYTQSSQVSAAEAHRLCLWTHMCPRTEV